MIGPIPTEATNHSRAPTDGVSSSGVLGGTVVSFWNRIPVLLARAQVEGHQFVGEAEVDVESACFIAEGDVVTASVEAS